jgi:teichuronic acid biosynthesis glycosyltransferase TuaG
MINEDRSLISVIMPIHNGAGTIHRAVSSVQRQQYDRWEIIAVDDASIDDSVDILNEFSLTDPRIRAIRLTENLGPSAARNEAMRQARGAVFTYLDCDDEYYPDYLGLVNYFSKKADVLVFVRYDSASFSPEVLPSATLSPRGMLVGTAAF